MNIEEALDVINTAKELGATPDDARAVLQAVSIGRLATAVRNIAHGDSTGPGGLEAVAMAIAGEGFSRPLYAAIDDLALEIRDNTAARCDET